ncbi:hypothetical protein INT48_006514 [Thamnidium elegans]|uniref:Uncharacterized protein n=1 Tax=Thamnidium elegans TaxID=101142 RepID=A0A8H7W074_9FUNG|nr:hypothetical protein INT48_006514 [Thamnidium elegans]
MGCCSSSPVDQDFLTTSQDNYDTVTIPLPVSYYNKSRPFKRSGLMWTSDTPMSVTDLEQKRLTYWESAPIYGGRIEIWQALQVAFSETDVIMARSILEAANVLLPTGNPCEGCFDVPPANLCMFDTPSEEFCSQDDKYDISDSMKSIYSNTQSDHLVPAPDCSLSPFDICIRLSTEKDINLTISSQRETVGSLRSRIYESKDSGIEHDTHILRLIYLGRILRDNLDIDCQVAIRPQP